MYIGRFRYTPGGGSGVLIFSSNIDEAYFFFFFCGGGGGGAGFQNFEFYYFLVFRKLTICFRCGYFCG